jgi:hypothetical protein
MTLIVVLNVAMSLLAVGAVAAGVPIARALQPASADEGGRASSEGLRGRRSRIPWNH